MSKVNVSSLKAKLSGHLRRVKAGQVLTVVDRNLPIAQIIPFSIQGEGLPITPPAAPGPVGELTFKRQTRHQVDSVTALIEERQRHR